MRFVLPLLALSLRSVAAATAATSKALVGTWSSGSGAVVTGPTFASFINGTINFNYPATAGWSFSFTSTGYFEQSQFTWVSNATNPHCVQAVVIWQHGTYKTPSDGTITTDPTIFSGDGRVQVQDACASQSSIISYYDQPGLYKNYAISQWRGQTMLQLAAYDGSLMPRMYQISTTPSTYMLPTSSLNNYSSTTS